MRDRPGALEEVTVAMKGWAVGRAFGEDEG
jgi:hypothetical protein